MVVGSAILGPQVLRCFSQTAWRLSHPAPTFLQTCENQLDNSMGLHETRVPNMIQYPTTPFIHENNILYIYNHMYIYTQYIYSSGHLPQDFSQVTFAALRPDDQRLARPFECVRHLRSCKAGRWARLWPRTGKDWKARWVCFPHYGLS